MTRPPPALRERVLRSTRARPSATRPRARPRRAAAVALSFSLAALAICARPGAPDPRPPVAVVAGCLWGALVLALVTLALFARRGALWPTRNALRATAWGAPAALALYPPLGAAIWPAHLPPDGVRGAVCLAASVALGGATLASLLAVYRKSDPVTPGLSGAALGALAGAWVALSQQFRCPFGAPSHALTAHVLPSLLLSGLGWLAGRYVLDPLARRGD